jgi:hypothetical protein
MKAEAIGPDHGCQEHVAVLSRWLSHAWAYVVGLVVDNADVVAASRPAATLDSSTGTEN